MAMAVKAKFAGKFVPCPQCREPVHVCRPETSTSGASPTPPLQQRRIKCDCPACRLLLVVKEKFAGLRVPCPRCHALVAVPREQPALRPQVGLARPPGPSLPAEPESPFDLEAMWQLASQVDRRAELDQLWSARRPSTSPSTGPAVVSPHDSEAAGPGDADFELGMAPSARESVGPPSWPPRMPPGTFQYPVLPIGPTATPLSESSVFQMPLWPQPVAAAPMRPPFPARGSGHSVPAMGAGSLAAPGAPSPVPPIPVNGVWPTSSTAPPTPLASAPPPSVERPAAPAAASEAAGANEHGQPSPASPSAGASSAGDGVVVACEQCRRSIKASRKLLGQKVKCPQCGTLVTVAEAPPADAPEAEPARSADPLPAPDIDLAEVVKASVEEPPPAVSEERRLQPTLRTSVFKRLVRKLEAAARPGAPRTVVEAAQEALQTLARSRDGRAAAAVVAVLPQLPLGLQAQALKQLGELGDATAFPAVAPFLASREEPLVRSAILGLGGLGDRRAAAALIALAVLQPQHRIRALEAVVKLGEAGLPALLKLLEQTSEKALQHAVIEALGRLRSPRGVPALAPFLSDSSVVMRRQAAEMLAQIGDAAAVAALQEALGDADEQVRRFAAEGMARHPDPRFAPALRPLLEDSSREVRLAALQALGACGDKRVVASLRPFLALDDEEFVMTAAEALGRLGDQESVSLLVERLEAIGDDVERQAATLRIVEALRRIGDERAALPLVNLLSHPSHRVRGRIAEALGRMKTDGVAPALHDLLRSDPQEEVQAAAARALGELGFPESKEVLVRVGLSERPSVRVQSLIALGRFQDPSLVPPVLELTTDPAPQVRYQAATLLGELGDRRAIPALEQLAGDAEELVRRAARRSLQQLGDTRSEAELQRAIGKAQRPRRPSATAGSAAGSSRPARARRFRFVDLVPSTLVGVLSLPAHLWGAVRASGLSALDRLPGGKTTLIAAGLLIAGGVYFFLQSSRGPVTYSSAPPRGYVAGLSATTDGRFIVAARTRGMIEIWDVSRQRVTDRATSVPSRWAAFHGDGTTILAADESRVQLIQVSSSGKVQSVQPLSGHSRPVVGLCRSQDGRYAATFDASGEVIRWNLATGEGQRLAAGTPLAAAALSPDGARLAGALSEAGAVVIWNMETGAEVVRCRLPKPEPISALAFSPQGDQLAAAVGTGASRLCLWAVDAPQNRPTLLESKLTLISSLVFRPDGRLVAADASAAEVWDLATASATTFNAGLSIHALATVGDDRLAVGDQEEPEILVLDFTGQRRDSLNETPRG